MGKNTPERKDFIMDKLVVPMEEWHDSSHSLWINPQTGRKEAIPRHNEIKKFLARSICRNLSVPIPPGN